MTYLRFNTRICRPTGLSERDRDAVMNYATVRLGHACDLRNIIDLVRYLLPNPPVRFRFRRRMLALEASDRRSAFVRLFWLRRSRVSVIRFRRRSNGGTQDFDVSPYFEVVKLTLQAGFDFRTSLRDDTGCLAATPAALDEIGCR